MKTSLLLLAALFPFTSFVATAQDDDDAKSEKPAAKKAAAKEEEAESEEEEDAKPAAKTKPAKPTKEKEEAEEQSDEQKALGIALENTSSLPGYHIEAVINTPAGKAILSGDLGVGSISLNCTDVKGVKKKRIVADKQFFLSDDGGKTWKTGDEAEKDITIMFSTLLTAPIQPSEDLLKETTFTSKEEKLGEETVLHIEKPAKGKSAAANYWLCKEPAMKYAVFIRKVSVTIAADDGEFPITVTYSKFDEPAEIKAPTVK